MAKNMGASSLPEAAMRRGPASPIRWPWSIAGLVGWLVLSSCGGSQSADGVPPTAPTGLTATLGLPDSVLLVWVAASDNVGVTGYVVVRDGINLDRTPPGTSYTDKGVAAGVRHCYKVVAYDAAGNASGDSNEACATIPDAPPSVPANVVATSAGVGRIDVGWSASTDDLQVDGYEVVRDGGEPVAVRGIVFKDSGLRPGSRYCYVVQAVDSSGNRSKPSDEACAEAGKDTTPPSVPTGLEATATAPGEIDLRWTASTDDVGVAGYTDVASDGTSFLVVWSSWSMAGSDLMAQAIGPTGGLVGSAMSVTSDPEIQSWAPIMFDRGRYLLASSAYAGADLGFGNSYVGFITP